MVRIYHAKEIRNITLIIYFATNKFKENSNFSKFIYLNLSANSFANFPFETQLPKDEKQISLTLNDNAAFLEILGKIVSHEILNYTI